MKYRNPIIPGFHPDPSVCRVGEDYYLVTSSFEYFPGIPIFHSRDLINWRQLGHVLTRRSQLDLEGARSSGGIYAPTIRFHDGVFYVIVTDVSGGGNFIVRATDPSGPWSEPIRIDQGGIDPSLFFDDDGRVYYTGTAWPEGELPGIAMFEIDVETGEKRSGEKLIWNGCGGRCPEGPHLYKIGGRYYLLIAEGGTEYGHRVTIASAEYVWGPYEPCPWNPILTQDRMMTEQCEIQATGHADLFRDHRGHWWLVFLGYRLSEAYFHHLGRETFLAPVTWRDGWPVVNGGAPIRGEMDGPLPETAPVALPPVRDDFSTGIGPAWNWLRRPDMANYDTGGGGIELIGTQVGLDDGASPTFLGRRQEQFDMRCGAVVEAANGTAGLTVFYNEEHHYDLFLADQEVVLCKRVGDMVCEAYRAPWSGGPCELRIEADRYRYAFSYGAPGGTLTSAGTGLTRLVSTEAARISFTGVYLAMFAQNGLARFRWFEYENLD